MSKKVLLLLLIPFFLFAKSDMEITAKSISSEGDIVKAENDAVVLYEGKYLFANRVYWDKNSSRVDLEGNVFIIDNNKVSVVSDKARINLDNNDSKFVPFFFVDEDTQLWIKSCEGEKKASLYMTENAIVSSCDPDDPDWTMEFSSSEYDGGAELLDLYNPVLYIKEFPLLYLPYLRISTNTDRRTGLLRPYLGFSNDEGFFYEQPIFIAPELWWDLELNPQIRTNRSLGMHGTFRFVNSANSSGFIKAGWFKEQADYVEENALQNSIHTGIELFYDDADVIDGIDDGFYFNGKKIRDIDYLNLLRRDTDTTVTGDLIESKMNYYATDTEYFLGSYSKYYDDTSKQSNADTLHLLPRTQLHKFNDTLFLDKILYSVDLQHSNYYRQEGLRAKQLELNLPLTFYSRALNDYLNFSVSENIYVTSVEFGDDSQTYRYKRNYHQVELYSDLIKKYGFGYHNINFGISYTRPGYEDEDLLYENLSADQQEFFSITTPQEGFNVYFKQYFYGFNEEELFYHSFNQPVTYENGAKVKGDMENTLHFSVVDGVSMKINSYYSHRYDKLSRISTRLDVKHDPYTVALTHFYNNNFDGTKSNYLTSDFSYKYKNYKFFLEFDYDYENRYAKKRAIGVHVDKDCWDYKIKYSEDIIPTLTSSIKRSKKNRAVYFEINLVPLGGFGYSF